MTNYTNVNHLINKKKSQPVTIGGAERSEYVLSKKKQDIEVHEVVDHEPSKEVSEYVESRQEKIKITKQLKQHGAVDTASTNFPSLARIKLPISDEKVVKGLHAPVTSSIRWLAELSKYILKTAHVGLKKIHGKIVRVIQ